MKQNSFLRFAHTRRFVGEPWNHETVGLIHFTPEGKIDAVKAYIDTQHVVKHLDAHKK